MNRILSIFGALILCATVSRVQIIDAGVADIDFTSSDVFQTSNHPK